MYRRFFILTSGIAQATRNMIELAQQSLGAGKNMSPECSPSACHVHSIFDARRTAGFGWCLQNPCFQCACRHPYFQSVSIGLLAGALAQIFPSLSGEQSDQYLDYDDQPWRVML